jgi:hypothetical protein
LEFGVQIIQSCKSHFQRSIELGCSVSLWLWKVCSQSRDLTVSRALHRTDLLRHLESANSQVAECEQIVADWRALIDTMQVEGRNVTVARDLLETFESNLKTRRSNRDLIQLTVVEGASNA